MRIETYDEHNISNAHDILSVRILREALGLPSLMDGYIFCLKCDKNFKSHDKKKNRICDECKGSKELDYSEHFVGICY